MSNRHRLPYAVLGGYLAVFLWAHLALAQENAPDNIPKRAPTVEKGQGVTVKVPSPESKAAEKPSGQKTPAAKPAPTAPVKNKRPTKPSCDARCQAAEQREKHGLEAQQSMATSAYDLVILTWWQFWVGVAGISLLFFTLYLTRQATQAAIRAAKAAEAAVNVASVNAQHQLRAYVLIGTSEIEMGADGTAKITVTAINAGQTPAKEFNLWLATSVLPYPFGGHILTPPPPPYKLSQSSIRPGGKAIAKQTKAVSQENQAAMGRGEKAIYVSGGATYFDVFGKEWETKYRLMHTGPWGGTKGLKVSPEGNEAT